LARLVLRVIPTKSKNRESSIESAKEAATRLVAQRMRSRFELKNRLRESGFETEHVEAAMEVLERFGYIDDASFARAFIMDKMTLRGHGEMRIRRELREHGVSESDTGKGFVLCEARFAEEGDTREEREAENALAALRKYARGADMTAAGDVRRGIAFLVRRGFAYGVVREAMKAYVKEIFDDDKD